MNLVMASVLLLAMLAFAPTLIYGSKGSNLAAGTGNGNGHGKKHSALSKASLVLSMESGDTFVRRARGAAGDAATPAVMAPSGGGKRGKNNNNNKKSNKNVAAAAAENAPDAAQSESSSSSSGGRKHFEKKFSAAVGNQQQHNNNKGKQRQLLKSQQHQSHGKRAGVKAANGEKSQSTCRYSKSAWSECDTKTNSRSRTLTLMKGESNCLPTRTIQKKCKKACRYEKGSWSECADGQMSRQDKLKTSGSIDSSSCEAVRSISKKCNPGGSGRGAKGGNKERKNKDKASRHAQQQA